MTPAVRRLVEWVEELHGEGKLNPDAASELRALLDAVRNEDPIALAFERARERFRRAEGAT